MIKSLLVYISAFTLLFLVIHLVQSYILKALNYEFRFSLLSTNIFFAVTSLVICAHLKLFSLIKILQPQLGFIYLPTLFIKGILFYLMFKSSVFNLDLLSTAERLNLLMPLFLFLGLEVYFIVKIIKKIDV